MKPIKRSRLRLFCGIQVYRLKRYWQWYTGRVSFAKQTEAAKLPHVHVTHQTPLLRKLSEVEMWMQHNKIINLRLAAQRLNGILVHPGETFSYWRLIGKPTRSKGYVDGMVLSHGRVGSGVGGGLCQLSNLIYWMTLHTPLTVTERYRHSYDVFPDAERTLPFGSGATCYYNYLDLQISNLTEQPFQLQIALTESHLAGEWRANLPPTRHYQVYEKKHWFSPEIWGGYTRHNELFRRIYSLEDELIDDEYLCENHAKMMYTPFLPENN